MAGRFFKLILFSFVLEQAVDANIQNPVQQYVISPQIRQSIQPSPQSIVAAQTLLSGQVLPANVLQSIAQNALAPELSLPPSKLVLPTTQNLAQLVPTIPFPSSLNGFPTLPSIPIPISSQTSSIPVYGCSNPPDSEVLNNLAIALQLLIVNNMLALAPHDGSSSLALPSFTITDLVSGFAELPKLLQTYSQSSVPLPVPLPSAAPVPVALPQPQTISVQQPTVSYQQSSISVQQPQTPYQNQPSTSVYSYPESYASQYSQVNYPQTVTYGQPSSPQYYQYESKAPTSAYSPSLYANANFLASSYVDTTSSSPITSFGVPPPRPRTSLSLMSPYEAVASSNSPYSDPILSSPYGSIITSKKDFQSPYQAILAADNARDLWN